MCDVCVCGGGKAAWKARKVQVPVSSFMNQLLSVRKRGSPVMECRATFIHTNSLRCEDDTRFIQRVWMCVWVCVDMRPTAVRIPFSIVCMFMLCAYDFRSSVHTKQFKNYTRMMSVWILATLFLTHLETTDCIVCVSTSRRTKTLQQNSGVPALTLNTSFSALSVSSFSQSNHNRLHTHWAHLRFRHTLNCMHVYNTALLNVHFRLVRGCWFIFYDSSYD